MFANMKVGIRLAIGFGLLLVLTAALGWIAIDSSSTLSTQTNKLYEHPYKVTRALLESRTNIILMSRDVRDAIIAGDPADVAKLVQRLETRDKALQETLAEARKQFPRRFAQRFLFLRHIEQIVDNLKRDAKRVPELI
jgi:methyl-accepting chemotaxis protein